MTDRFSGPKRANGTFDGWFLGAVFAPISKSIPLVIFKLSAREETEADAQRANGAFVQLPQLLVAGCGWFDA